MKGMKKLVIIVFASSVSCIVSSSAPQPQALAFAGSANQEYIYPVGSSHLSDDVSFLYVVHQDSTPALHLYAWNPQTKIAYPLLHSLFSPVNVSPIVSAESANNAGFSFVDQGRIRIKRFNKRSPKTIDLYEPIYNPGPISWINEHNGYFFGKKADTYGVFHITAQGDIEDVCFNYHYDCMFPQKVGDQLFYITRTAISGNEYRYGIFKKKYPVVTYEGDRSFNNDRATTSFLTAHDASESIMLISGEYRNIGFLKMVDQTKGFYIESTSHETQDLIAAFVYHMMYWDGECWQTRPLFTFNLPIALRADKTNGLYESIVPLLPYYHNSVIYFSDYCGTSLKPFAYSIASNTKHSLETLCQDVTVFSPIFFQGRIFYGGPTIKQGSGSVVMEEVDGTQYFDLPSMPSI